MSKLEKIGEGIGHKVAARVTIVRPADMTDNGRRSIAEWLHKVADDLVRSGHEYSPAFTARYWYKSHT